MIEFWAEAGPCERSVQKAIEYVHAAREAGASALKVQWYRPETLVQSNTPRYDNTSGDAKTQGAAFSNSIYPYERWGPVIEECQSQGLEFIPAVFDIEAVQVAKEFELRTIKIASGDITYLDLIEKAAAGQDRIAISTGASTLDEVGRAMKAASSDRSPPEIILLACHSEYPTPAERANIARTFALQGTFPDATPGFSDHTAGIGTIPLMVAAGVFIIEKHFTLEANQGYDSDFALTPSELRNAILSTQRTVAMMGDGALIPTEGETAARFGARRSLVLTESLSVGTVLAPHHLIALRPHQDAAPSPAERIIGRRLNRDLSAGDVLTWKDLAE